MITESYRYLATKRKTQYTFQSEGLQGKIVKIILFDLQDNGEWNLGFGDWSKGKVDDSVISNNHDAFKVIGTVAKATLDFFEEYPESIVIIKPVDEKRKKLYNTVFQRHFKDINPLFDVVGFINGEKEVYSPQKFFDSFKIPLKFVE